MATVQVPVPLLDVLTETRTAFFGLSLDAVRRLGSLPVLNPALPDACRPVTPPLEAGRELAVRASPGAVPLA
jgi:hypothetical protein